MKSARQDAILSIISEKVIETQNQLQEELEALGITTTQATLSRDIKDLHLIKQTDAEGRSHYAVQVTAEARNTGDRLQTIFRQSVLSMDTAMNLVVIKTLPGLANAVGSTIDGLDISSIVGTIAGDDTCFLAMRSAEDAEHFIRNIEDHL